MDVVAVVVAVVVVVVFVVVVSVVVFDDALVFFAFWLSLSNFAINSTSISF